MKVSVTSRSFSRNNFLKNELLKIYPKTKFNDKGLLLNGDELINFIEDSSKAIIALENINECILSQLPNLRVISKYGVGLDKIDLKALSKYKLKIGWYPGVNKRSVSELALGFMISSLRKLRFCQNEILKGRFTQISGSTLSDKVVGIIGCGNVGKDLVELLKPFGCKILVNDIINYEEFYKKHNIIKTNLKNLLINSDIITLHTPLTEKTYKLIGKNEFSIMKKNSILINTARGKLVDEKSLLDALLNEKISYAAFDVFFEEPPTNKTLLKHNNLIISPHIGGSTDSAIINMGMAAIKGLDNPKDPLSLLKFQ